MSRQMVIARASGGEPLLRVLVKIGEKVVYLANPDLFDAVVSGKSSAVGFPPIDVYDFDKSAFIELQDRWHEAQLDQPELWKPLKRFNSTVFD